MSILFEVLKGVFFFLTVIIALFFLRGEVVIGVEYYETVKQILMPGYLLFCGMMLGYIIAQLRGGNKENIGEKNQILVKSFMIGLGTGLFLAITYMVV